MGYFDVARARPQLAAREPKTEPAVRINRHHGVQEHAENIAFADLSQPAAVFWRGGKLDVAGVLDRQHVTAASRNPRLLAPAFDQLVDGDARIVYKPPIPHLRRPQPSRRRAQALLRDFGRAIV